MNKSQRGKQVIIFWLIILGSILVVIVVFSALALYQYQSTKIAATSIAAPTTTAEALEASYQKGLAYINIGRWQEAKTLLELVFETDPNYKDVQARLNEVYQNEVHQDVREMPTSDTRPTTGPVDSSNQSEATPDQEQGGSQQSAVASKQTGGLVALWDFNETSGTTANGTGESQSLAGILMNFADTSGQDVTEGSGWTSTHAHDGIGALMLDGVDDYVRIPRTISGGDFTICSWFNVRGVDLVNHNSIIVGQQSGGLTYFALYYTDTGRLGIGINAGADNILSNDAVSFNQWHFGCIRYGDNIANIFVDAKRQQNSYTGPFNYGGNEIILGRNNYQGGQQYLNGVIDTVSIYQRALSDSEIEDLYREH